MLVEVNPQALNTLSITEPLRHLMLSVCLEGAVKFGMLLKKSGELLLYVVFANGAVLLNAVSERIAVIACHRPQSDVPYCEIKTPKP